MAIGKFHGVIAADHAERLAAAVEHVRSARSAAARRRPCASPRRRSTGGCRARACTSPVASASVLPSSRVSVRATSSSRSVEQLGRLEEDGAARRRRRGRPGRERLGRGGDRLRRVGRGRAREHGEHLVGARRVPRLETGVVARADPLAADQVLAGLHRPPRRRDVVSPPRRNDTTDGGRAAAATVRRPPCGGAPRAQPAPGSGTSARSESRSVSRYPASRATRDGLVPEPPDVLGLVRVRVDHQRDAARVRGAQDGRRRVHDAGRVADAVGVQLERAAGRGEGVERRVDLRAAQPAPAGAPTGRCSRGGRGRRSGPYSAARRTVR